MTLEPMLTAPFVIQIHSVFGIIALSILPFQAMMPKGTPLHRTLGWAWVIAMALLAVGSFGIRTHDNMFSWIHGLSAFTLFSLSMAVISIRRGKVAAHKRWIIGTSAGLLVAFAFTFLPSRILGQAVGF